MRWGVGCFEVFRFEGDYAVVVFTGRRMVDVHKRDLPSELKDGELFEVLMEYVFDEVETERIKIETRAMFHKMWE